MDNCIRCGQPGAENYMSDYGAYLCDDCLIEFNKGLDKFRKDFILAGKDCDTCKHRRQVPFALPCSYCCRNNITCTANMWEAKEENADEKE